MSGEAPATRGAAAALSGIGPRGVDVRPVDSGRDLDAFIRLPWRIYEDDPAWIPPLRQDVRALLDARKHPFHRHAQVACFIAWNGAHAVGRIAAVLNHRHIEFHGEAAGFFGLFETVDDAGVSHALLETAEQWLGERGMRIIRGPFNLSTNDELYSGGVLVDGFGFSPLVMMGHTPPYYAPLLERAGYVRSKDLLCYWLAGEQPPERLTRGAERLLRREGITIRAIDMRRFEAEVAAVQDIYNSAWERNWGFVPMSEHEIHHLAKQLRPAINPRLCAIAEIGGQPVGFALGLPDYNQALRHTDGRLFPIGLLKLLWYRRKIDAARVLTLGVKAGYRNKGLDALLILHIWKEGVRAGYAKGECSWILEDNWDMRRGLERIGASVYKTYRVYEKPLD
jgi:GNAT superfamily N-acetyltransferase